MGQNISSFHNLDWRCVLHRCHCVLLVRVIHVHATRVPHSNLANIHCRTSTSALQSGNAAATFFLISFPVLSGADSRRTAAQNKLWTIHYDFISIQRGSKHVSVNSVVSIGPINPTIIVTRPDKSILGFSLDTACSGVYPLIAFVMFAFFTAYIIRKKPWKKRELGIRRCSVASTC